MPNKDLCEKDLLRVPAVFASLVNLLLFDNKNVIQPEQIRYLDFSAHFFSIVAFIRFIMTWARSFLVRNTTSLFFFVSKTRRIRIG